MHGGWGNNSFPEGVAQIKKNDPRSHSKLQKKACSLRGCLDERLTSIAKHAMLRDRAEAQRRRGSPAVRSLGKQLIALGLNNLAARPDPRLTTRSSGAK